jgi:hypothetical protein
MVAPYEHYRAGVDAPVEPGVYRVVGEGEETVTLLRVAADGQRVNDGVVVHLDRAHFDALDTAGNPDAGLGRLRQAPANLAAHPLVSAGALAAVAGGGYLATAAGGLPEDVGAVALAVGGVTLWLLAK